MNVCYIFSDFLSDFLQNNDKLSLVVGRKKTTTSSSLKRPGQQPQQQAQNGTSVVASSEDVVDGGVPGAVNGADGVNSGKDRKMSFD